MSEKMTQIVFRVPESFRKRMEHERTRRDVKLQDMIRYGLELYFQTPVEWDHATTIYSTTDSDEETRDLQVWADLWLHYISQMPRKKTEFFAEVMKLDLANYRSSRTKTAAKKPHKKAEKE